MIHKNYEVLSKIGQGKFGGIYQGLYKKKEKVAIKVENLDSEVKLLKHETTILNYLYNKGSRNTPHVYYYGLYKGNPILIMPFYETTLESWNQNKSKNERNKLFVKMIEILSIVHEFGVLHRDIKLDNFMIKNNDVYLIDFGLSTIYIDEESKHCTKGPLSECIIGTPKFISIHIHNGEDASRRDDLISLLYLFILLDTGSLLWENVHEDENDSYTPLHILNTKNQKRKLIKTYYQQTMENKIMKELLDYAYFLDFEEDPRYQWMIMQLEENI